MAVLPSTTSSERAEPTTTPVPIQPTPRRRSKWRVVFWVVVVFALALIAFRLYLPTIVRGYVNQTLDRSELYRGRIGEIDIRLWDGFYSIHDIRLNKQTGDVPVPLFQADRVDLALQWNALMHGRLVGKVVLYQPQLNFVDAPDTANAQTGAGGPWGQMITDLFPFKINSVEVRDGSIHFRTYTAKRPVDVYLSKLTATVDDLTNVNDQTTPLITTVTAHALAMDQAKFEVQMKLDPFSYRPTFHMAMRLLGLDVTKVNDMAITYGQFDFKGGWFDLVVEADASNGTLSGYVKPLFRNLQIFSLIKDAQNDNPLRFFWQALLGVAQEVFKNQSRDQFGTYIPFTGDVSAAKPDLFATIGNVLRNAFVRAYLPKLQPGATDDDLMLKFDAPSLNDPTSAGDSLQ